jgi:hypothetical protein
MPARGSAQMVPRLDRSCPNRPGGRARGVWDRGIGTPSTGHYRPSTPWARPRAARHGPRCRRLQPAGEGRAALRGHPVAPVPVAHRLAPLTTKPTYRPWHREYTNRSRQSRTGVSAPCRATSSAGSGSTDARAPRHQTIRRNSAFAALPSLVDQVQISSSRGPRGRGTRLRGVARQRAPRRRRMVPNLAGAIDCDLLPVAPLQRPGLQQRPVRRGPSHVPTEAVPPGAEKACDAGTSRCRQQSRK